MSRKATFSPKKPKKNSSEHNSRKEMPPYLIETEPAFDGNFYERLTPYEDDKQFVLLAQKIYKDEFFKRTGQKQSMQKKQSEALIFEVVITVNENHTKQDILNLFDMLKREKAKDNALKENIKINRLKPLDKLEQFILPKKLKIKRKPKKENLNETGYHILEIAGHYDEGHFIRKGKWENLSYYPSKHIMMKSDGNWYIKSNELDENTSEEAFDVLADMSEFEKVYNLHWHVKFTNFNLDTGLTASFSKGEISGEGRLKKVAEHLGLRYVPEEKISLEQGVRSIKEQHHKNRQEKYLRLTMKFSLDKNHHAEVNKTMKREALLRDRITRERKGKKENDRLLGEMQTIKKNLELKTNEADSIQYLYNENIQQTLIQAKKILEQEDKIRELEATILQKEKESQNESNFNKELTAKLEEKDNLIKNQLEEIETLETKYKVQEKVFEELIYTGHEYPSGIDESGRPIGKFKETWKEFAKYESKKAENLKCENEDLLKQYGELKTNAYMTENVFCQEIQEYVTGDVLYKDAYERSVKQLEALIEENNKNKNSTTGRIESILESSSEMATVFKP
ncbi:MAG: hypothetical protein B7Y23_07775 [Sulfurovum sp. 16-42-52]|nr:MAG: hypothetical protein B7Y23_07775 [Sulfurovum sp. 16-42-52]OZA44856.1 MAG: hypothetical protein B7X80_06615 [Sulfurovum sp. 17-42-90]